MTIAQALKEKNKRLNQINKLWERLATNNSIPEGNERAFNPDELLNQLRDETDLFIELKTKTADSAFEKGVIQRIKDTVPGNTLHKSHKTKLPREW